MSILEQIYQHPLLSPEDIRKIASVHRKTTYPKGSVLLERNKIAESYFCLEDGLVRSYIIDYQGNEITTGFMARSNIAIEVLSLFKKSPSQESLQALTDCSGYEIDFESFQYLFHELNGFREWGRSWMAQQLFLLKSRTIAMISEPAASRYKELVEHAPEIVRHAPLKHIASYLGITDTSLSRIRKEISRI